MCGSENPRHFVNGCMFQERTPEFMPFHRTKAKSDEERRFTSRIFL